MTATVIPDIKAAGWASRQVALYPPDWTSDAAKDEGGILYSLFKSIGSQLEHNDGQLIYDFKASRIKTAIDVALDAVAADYFDDTMIRRTPGEPDESLRDRILAELLMPNCTRESLNTRLFRLVGIEPRLMEPWNVNDTCAWDSFSYWDVDNRVNSFRWGSPELTHQGFVESQLPSYADQGDNPVWAWDMGWAWDTPGSAWLDPKPTWFQGVRALDGLINRTKVFGTIIWRKYANRTLNRYQVGGSNNIVAGATSMIIEIFPPFEGTYSVLAICNWNAVVDVEIIDEAHFNLIFSAPCPAGGGEVMWLATPITFPGFGLVSLPTGVTEFTIGVPAGMNTYQPIISTSLAIPYWVKSLTSSLLTVGLAQATPELMKASYGFIAPPKSGSVAVTAGAVQVTVPISTRDPFQAFVIPDWNTAVELDRTTTLLTASFSNPCPTGGGTLRWGIHES